MLSRLTTLLRRISMLGLVVMMTITVIDVGMRMLVNQLVLGSVELVQLMLVIVVFLALPETFARNEQVTVDAIDQLVGPRVVRLLQRVAAVLTALVMVVMAWRTIPPALDTLDIGDLTSDLQISLFWYWLPVVIGAVCAAIVVVVRLAASSAGGSESDPEV